MKRGRFAKVALALLCAAALFVHPAPAHATQTITITPTAVEKTINPGTSTQGTVQVLNQGDTEFDYKMYTTPYSVNGEEYDPSFTPIAGATDVTNWIRLKPASGHLTKYSVNDVTYTITVPSDAKPGGYYAVIFAETQSVVKTTGVATRQRVGSILYIQVAGDAVQAGKVATWESNWLQYPPLTALLRLENSGSVHYRADVKVAVKDIFGNVKYRYNQSREILPQKVRRMPIEWDKAPALGLFKVEGTATFLGKSHPLKTQYVLVASQSVRHDAALIVGALVVLLILGAVMKRRKKTSKKTVAKSPDDQSGDKPKES